MKPRIAWPVDFLTTLQNNIPRANPPAPAKTWEFHLVSLLWVLKPCALRRSQIGPLQEALLESFKSYRWGDGQSHAEWFPSRVDEDSDSIQHVNKSGQWGVKHRAETLERPDGRKATYYFFRDLLEPSEDIRYGKPPSDPFRSWVPPAEALTPTEYLETPAGAPTRQDILEHLAHAWTSVPEEDWTNNAHRDPDNKVEGGLCSQPKKYNRKQRNRFKFDKYGLPLCPTVGHLMDNLDLFYPSEVEKRRLFGKLQEVLGIDQAT